MKFLQLLIVFISLSAQAEFVEGELHFVKGDYAKIVLSQTHEVLKVEASTNKVLKELAMLNTGDYIVSEGRINHTTEIANIDSISFVGLKSLLGTWVTADKQKYIRVISKNEIEMFSDKGITKYFYSLTPIKRPHWTLMLNSVETGEPKVAKLEFINRKETQELKVFTTDANIGEIKKTVTLKRL